ncbi:MAG: DNA polymerase Y family protein [Rhizobiales bacterium]|nr:DNA polymerase Y family protein [Hyphomicrobiales bacterium]
MLALWLVHWPAERARAGKCARSSPSALNASAPDAPFVTTLSHANARRLAGVDATAAALGLVPGMMLTEARALVPSLIAIEADEAGDAAALEKLALWCRRYSPMTAPRPPDAVLIDITGVAHLFSGEEALIDDALARLTAMGLTAHAAIADFGPAALALTRAHRRFISAPGNAAADLGPLPVSVLDLDSGALARLAVMGLRRIGDLTRFGRAKLRVRLGAEAMDRLDAVMGWRRAPLSPIAEAVPIRVMRRFAEPIDTMAAVEATLQALAPALEAELDKRGEGARRLALTLFRVDGAARALSVTAAASLRATERIIRLFRDRLVRLEGGLDPGFGFDLITLEACVTEPLGERQENALGSPYDHAAAAPLIDRLAGRLGLAAIRRLEPASSHIPERAVLLVPAASMDGRPDWEGEPWRTDQWGAAAGEPPARPLALLPAPEPIEAVAEVPDGPPMRFVWRRIAHRVIAADGPERIAGEWWRDTAPTRDYYRLEDEAGRRFWVYRSGLYERETNTPRWYMHGLFP